MALCNDDLLHIATHPVPEDSRHDSRSEATLSRRVEQDLRRILPTDAVSARFAEFAAVGPLDMNVHVAEIMKVERAAGRRMG